MGDPKGFMKYPREGPKRKPVELRVLDWKEMYEPISEDRLKIQGARCMDCGVPFCQGSTGCPVVTSSRNGTISSIGGGGRMPSRRCTRPITFRNSPADSVRLRAKAPACSASMKNRCPFA